MSIDDHPRPWNADWLFTRGPGHDFTVAQSDDRRFRLHLNPDAVIPLGADIHQQVFYGSAIMAHQAGRVTWGCTRDARIEFHITWDDHTSGEYVGAVRTDGHLRGTVRGDDVAVDWWNHDDVVWGPPDGHAFRADQG